MPLSINKHVADIWHGKDAHQIQKTQEQIKNQSIIWGGGGRVECVHVCNIILTRAL